MFSSLTKILITEELTFCKKSTSLTLASLLTISKFFLIKFWNVTEDSFKKRLQKLPGLIPSETFKDLISDIKPISIFRF